VRYPMKATLISTHTHSAEPTAVVNER